MPTSWQQTTLLLILPSISGFWLHSSPSPAGFRSSLVSSPFRLSWPSGHFPSRAIFSTWQSSKAGPCFRRLIVYREFTQMQHTMILFFYFYYVLSSTNRHVWHTYHVSYHCFSSATCTRLVTLLLASQLHTPRYTATRQPLARASPDPRLYDHLESASPARPVSN